jgi:dipeptidyl aminopeptidase/acylaminoacyl peptidase
LTRRQFLARRVGSATVAAAAAAPTGAARAARSIQRVATLALITGALLGTPASAASAATSLTWENIFSASRGARQSVISPDGRWVAVTATTERESGIFVVPADGSAPPVFWGRGASPVWFPDSSRILFTAENDLWTAPLRAGAPSRVTNDPQDERDATISPDGRTIAFYSTRSGSQDIWVVPAASGVASRQLTTKAMTLDDGRFAPAWSPDGTTIAYVSNAADFWADDVWAVDVASGKTRQFSRGLMAMSTPVWSPDGKSIALLGTSKKGYWYEDLSDIFVVDAATGAERTVEMQVYATDWLHSLPVFWSADGRQLFFVYHERGLFNLWAVPAAGGVATRITNLDGVIRSIRTSAKADRFAFIYTTPVRGPDVVSLPATGGSPARLTSFADEWSSVQAPHEVSYRSFDGLYIQGFLFLPPNMKPDEKYPALVNVHGGGTNSYLQTLNLNEQYLASRGYVVLAINYRGGSGFGREFQDLSVNRWASDQAHDAAAAGEFLRTLPYSNGKVGIYGYSYGGIMSMAAITRHPDVFDAAVPMAGIYDFADAYSSGDRLQKIFTMTGHGGPPEKRREVYALSDSLARVPNIKTPLLIMHGEADVRAPYRQYELAVEALKKHGKRFESRSYPGEPHGFRNPANRVDMYQRLEGFLDRHLKGSGSSHR